MFRKINKTVEVGIFLLIMCLMRWAMQLRSHHELDRVIGAFIGAFIGWMILLMPTLAIVWFIDLIRGKLKCD